MSIVPFKGIYLKYTGKNPPVKVNVYPVPNLKNPFLGVHYTITVNNEVKIESNFHTSLLEKITLVLIILVFSELINVLIFRG